MPDYAVFGGFLRSELELDSLPPLPDSTGVAPDWRLRAGDRVPERRALAQVGEVADDGFRVTLSRHEDGWRLAYDDTGTYDVSADGARLAWYPGPAAAPELVQADVLGRVLALALGAAGALPLHGSAVTLGGRGVVFLAPKHHGKSTLAAALTLAGGRLVTDDMAVVDPGPPARLRPGVATLRLWREAADHLGGSGMTGTLTDGIKQTLSDLPSASVETRPAPLAAIYLLSSVADGPPARRARLGATEAALALVTHGKLGELLGGVLAMAHLARAASVASRIPVYSLQVARGLDRLPEAAARIAAWHRPRVRVAR